MIFPVNLVLGVVDGLKGTRERAAPTLEFIGNLVGF